MELEHGWIAVKSSDCDFESVMQQTHLSEAVIIFIINVTASHAGALPLQLQPVSEQIQ